MQLATDLYIMGYICETEVCFIEKVPGAEQRKH